LKGRDNVVIRQVPLSVNSLNAGDVFLLDNGLQLFQWNGPSSNHFERRKASEVVNSIKGIRNV